MLLLETVFDFLYASKVPVPAVKELMERMLEGEVLHRGADLTRAFKDVVKELPQNRALDRDRVKLKTVIGFCAHLTSNLDRSALAWHFMKRNSE